MTEFSIPLALEDLSTSTVTNQYCVKNISDVNSLSSHLNVVESKLSDSGPAGIYRYFDYFYSVLFHWSSVNVKVRDKIWLLLVENCQQWGGKVVAIDNNDDHQFKYRNCIKMVVYLIFKCIELYESQIQSSNIIMEKGKGKKKKPQTSSGITSHNWPKEVEDAVNAISQLSKAPIEKLWTPPVVEIDFVNLLSNCCYKLMENSDYCKNNLIRNPMVDILIKLNKHHNHTNDCSIKLGQLLQSHQHFVSTLQYICSMFLENNLSLVVREILREICSYSGADLEHNSQASSNFGSFLSEFGSQNPNEIVPLLPVLIDKLQEEPFSMRNAVLTILGEVVLKVYKDDAHNRDSILDVIQQHILEGNAFVRTKALSVLVNIVESNQGLTLDQKNNLMKQLIGETGAIFDSSGNVRKHVIRILACFLQQNMAKGLTEADLTEDLKVAKALHEKAEEKYNDIMNMDEDEFLKGKITELESEDVDMEDAANNALETFEGKKKELQKNCEITKGTLVILEQTIEYTRLLNHAVSDMAYMLNSKTVSDVLESIAFFVDAKLNKMPHVDVGVRKMLLHISSKDETIKSAVAEAYKRLYLSIDDDGIEDNSENTEPKSVAVKIVNRLCGLIHNSNYGELLSLEMLIGHFAKKGEITDNVVDCLWKRCMSQQNNAGNNNNNQTNVRMRRYAAVVFSMVAQNELPFMKNYFNYFIQQQLSFEWLKSLDFYHVAYLCQAIQNLASSQTKLKAEPFRLPSDHSLFTNLSNLCVETMTNKTKPNWIFMNQEIINTIYQLSESPSTIISSIIHNLALCTFQVDKENHENNNDPFSQVASQPTGSQPNPNNLGTQIAVDYDLLTRFMSVAGHAIIKQFTHFEVSILNELKRRNQIQEAVKDQVISQGSSGAGKDKKSKKTKPHNASIASSVATRPSTKKVQDGGENLEEEMGLAGASADDAEAEFIRRICDQELVMDPSKLFHRIVELAAWICSKGPASATASSTSSTGLRNLALQTQSVLALAKAMVVSEPVCLKHVDLLFRVAERSPSKSLRANLLAAFGDLVRRFPHVLEPYTKRLYARLIDESVCVRTSALNVISHLVLNDMIKVKGQISEMTKCLVDSDSRIVHLSRVFFQELSNKDKALYNIMPDIISNLSDPEIGVDEKNFHVIMEFLMPFIQKKNLNENLFEKICARFDPSGQPLTWKNMAYCLSLLHYNENMIESLQYRIKVFAPMLHVPEVFECLSSVLERARKTIKNDKLEMLDEIARKLKEMRDKGVEDEEVKLNAERAAHQKKLKHTRHHKQSSIRKKSSGGMGSPPKRVNSSQSNNTPSQSPASKHSKQPTVFSSDDSDGPGGGTEGANNRPEISVRSTRSLRSTAMDESTRSLKQKKMRVLEESSDDEEEDDDFE